MHSFVTGLVAVGLSLSACSSGDTGDLETQPGDDPSATEQVTTDTVAPTVPETSTTALPQEPALVYVSVSGERRVAILELGVDGGLAPVGSVDLPGPAGAMVHSELRNELFVGAGAAVSTLVLDDPIAPGLTGTTPVDGEPVYLDLAADDSLLLSAYFGEDEVRAHLVADAPAPYPLAEAVPSDVEPHAIVVTDDGGRAYVPQRNGDSIGIYTVGPDGALRATGNVDVEPGTGPRHLVLSPAETHAYVVNEHADSVTVFQIAGDGGLTPLQTVSTLPDDVDGEANTGADIHLTPDGAYLYTSNRGHDSIALFAVDPDGTLMPLGQVATQARPRDFGMSPDGRFVVVAGQDSGAVETYRVGADGLLTSLGVTAVGDGPVWVTILEGRR